SSLVRRRCGGARCGRRGCRRSLAPTRKRRDQQCAQQYRQRDPQPERSHRRHLKTRSRAAVLQMNAEYSTSSGLNRIPVACSSGPPCSHRVAPAFAAAAIFVFLDGRLRTVVERQNERLEQTSVSPFPRALLCRWNRCAKSYSFLIQE